MILNAVSYITAITAVSLVLHVFLLILVRGLQQFALEASAQPGRRNARKLRRDGEIMTQATLLLPPMILLCMFVWCAACFLCDAELDRLRRIAAARWLAGPCFTYGGAGTGSGGSACGICLDGTAGLCCAAASLELSLGLLGWCI
jgi:hypothetical protein